MPRSEPVLWFGRWGSRRCVRPVCSRCRTEPADSRTGWNRACTGPRDSHSTCSLTRDTELYKEYTIQHADKGLCAHTYLRWCHCWRRWRSVHQTQKVSLDRNLLGNAPDTCGFHLSAGKPLYTHPTETTMSNVGCKCYNLSLVLNIWIIILKWCCIFY